MSENAMDVDTAMEFSTEAFSNPDYDRSNGLEAMLTLAAEVRCLRAESTDVFECADGTVAKDATVAAQTWADECRRLREREAKARELMERIIRDASVYYDVGMYIPDATRWLAEGE